MVPELYQSSGQPRRKFSLEEIRILLCRARRSAPPLSLRAHRRNQRQGLHGRHAGLHPHRSGLRTGLYTSPHLARVNERIRLIASKSTTRSLPPLLPRPRCAQQLVLDERLPQMPSFFEILTAQALLYFAEQQVDIAVLEVGMGGRLDATNIVDPLLSVITDISLDHTEWLGSPSQPSPAKRPASCAATEPWSRSRSILKPTRFWARWPMELGVRGVSAVALHALRRDLQRWTLSVEALGANPDPGRLAARRRAPASQPGPGHCRGR
jgi:hypothetical protein